MRRTREEFKKKGYSTEAQKHLLAHLLSDPDRFARCRRIVKDEYFDDQLAPTVRYVLEHADTYHSIPHVDLIKTKTGLTLTTYSAEVVEQQNGWFLDEIQKFCKRRAIQNLFFDDDELVWAEEYGEVERRMREALTISLMSELGTEYFVNPKERLQRLLDNSHKISTGWKELDGPLYGGFGKGALQLFLGNSGAGKSLVLQNLSLNWALAGFNGVYFSLELSEEEICLKLDAMLTGMGTREVVRSIDDVAFRVAVKGKQSGKLTIKRLPENSTNVNDLEAYLKEYEISTGARPDFIVVDYLDLLIPNNSRVDPSNLFVKDKFVSEELRALMYRTDSFGATAGQLNRSSVDVEKGEFTHAHVAGGISKINTADNVFGLFATSFMKERGEFQLTCMKARSSAALGKVIKLSYNPESMRISDPTGEMRDVDRPTSPEQLRQQTKAPSEPQANSVTLETLIMGQRRKRDEL